MLPGKEKIMRILLIMVYDKAMSEEYEEIGLCYIASYLREQGYTVMLYGVQYQMIDYDKITKFHPDMVGYTVYHTSKNAVLNVADNIKVLLPNSLNVLGGIYPTYQGKELLDENSFIDYVIAGEGEATFLELIETINAENSLHSVDGLLYREGSKSICNPERALIHDLNCLPWPSRDMLKDNHLSIAIISTSRGCTAKCSFCASQLFWQKWRGRDSVDVVNEIEHIVNNFQVTSFNFIDGSFEDPDRNLTRLRSIAELLVERNLKISYFADFRAEFHQKADNKLMELLKKSGLCGVCVGFESVNKHDIELYNKNADYSDYEKTISLFRQFDIFIDPGIINFNPYTTHSDLFHNLNFIRVNNFAGNIYFLLSRFVMFDGTTLSNQIQNDQQIKKVKNDYGYQFFDERIETFFNFTNNYIITQNDQNFNVWTRLQFYSCKYQVFLQHLTINFSRLEDNEAIYVLKNHIDETKQVLNFMNQKIVAWFSELVCLSEQCWSDNKAYEICLNMLPVAVVTNAVNNIDLLRKKLISKLMKIDMEYSQYLFNVQL